MSAEFLFGSQTSMTWWQEVARALLIFFYGLALVRLAGRRVFGKWAALDIIVPVIIGSSLSRALTGNAPLWSTIGASTVIMAVHWLLAQAVARSPVMSHFLEGRAVRLIDRGTLDHAQRKFMAVSQADIGEALRRAGVERIEDIRELVVEPSGKLTAMKR